MTDATQGQQSIRHRLTVWYGSMPESNGKANWTAILGREGDPDFDMHIDGFCFARSEYPERVRYDADHMRWVIGEQSEKPCLLDYDEKAHSGYVAPIGPPGTGRSMDQAIRTIPLPSSKGINAWIDAQIANNVHGSMAGDEVVTVEAASEIARGAALAIIADRETLIANLRGAGYVVTAPGEENFR